MITALLVDDEPKATEVLRFLIDKHCKEIRVVGIAEDIDEAMKIINLQNPQLIFLDIEMSGGNGFEFLERIPVKNFHVIFVSAYNQFAVKAFRFSAVDYLMKPVDVEELKQAVQKVQTLIESSMQEPSTTHVLRIASSAGVEFIKMSDIIRLQADGKYTNIYVEKRKHFYSSYNLKHFEDNLDANKFIRVHRSTIINIDKVVRIQQRYNYKIELTDGTEIIIARRIRSLFLQAYNARKP